MTHELEKSNVIEPEIIDEQGRTVNAQPEDCDISRAAGKSALTIFGTLLAFAAGVLMFVLFAVVAIVVAIPFLILSLFGKKPNIKVFKFGNFDIRG